MATAIPSAPITGNVTHECKILVGWDEGGDWIDVTSPRGNTVTVHLRGKSLSVEESKFIDSLLEVSESVRPLTVEQMRLIKRLADMGETPLPSQAVQPAPGQHGQGVGYPTSHMPAAPVLEPARAVTEASPATTVIPATPQTPAIPATPPAIDPVPTPPVSPVQTEPEQPLKLFPDPETTLMLWNGKDDVDLPPVGRKAHDGDDSRLTPDTAYVMFGYDIPEGSIPNPARLCWRYGFRADNRSQWIFREDHQPWQLYDAIDFYNNNREPGQQRIISRRFPFRPTEPTMIRDMARNAINEEVHRVHGSLILLIDKANREYERIAAASATQTKELDNAKRERENAIRARLRKAAQELNEVITSAQVFDETENVQHLFDALQQAIDLNSRLYGISTEMKRIRKAPSKRPW